MLMESRYRPADIITQGMQFGSNRHLIRIHLSPDNAELC
jgi:hypothetical protein